MRAQWAPAFSCFCGIGYGGTHPSLCRIAAVSGWRHGQTQSNPHVCGFDQPLKQRHASLRGRWRSQPFSLLWTHVSSGSRRFRAVALAAVTGRVSQEGWDNARRVPRRQGWWTMSASPLPPGRHCHHGGVPCARYQHHTSINREGRMPDSTVVTTPPTCRRGAWEPCRRLLFLVGSVAPLQPSNAGIAAFACVTSAGVGLAV